MKFDIEPGSYSILDIRFEENHYWAKWYDKRKENRDEYFVFAGDSKAIEKD